MSTIGFYYPGNLTSTTLQIASDGLLKARRYLEKDFLEIRIERECNEWSMGFYDSTIVSSRDFDHMDTIDRDSLLIKMTGDPRWDIVSERRVRNIFRNEFRNRLNHGEYVVDLHVLNSTPSEEKGDIGKFFPDVFPGIYKTFFPDEAMRYLPNSPFCLSVDLWYNPFFCNTTTKAVSDNLSRYKQELKDTIFGTSSTTMPTIQPSQTQLTPNPAQPQQPQSQIINPWEVKIPTVESLIMGGGR